MARRKAGPNPEALRKLREEWAEQDRQRALRELAEKEGRPLPREPWPKWMGPEPSPEEREYVRNHPYTTQPEPWSEQYPEPEYRYEQEEELSLLELLIQNNIPVDVFSETEVIDMSPWNKNSAPTTRGPDGSTRLRSHIFVVDDSEVRQLRSRLETGSLSASSIDGYVYVTWVKTGRNGNVSKYGPLPLSSYIQFKNSPSLGRAVVNLPNHQYAREGIPSNDWLNG